VTLPGTTVKESDAPRRRVTPTSTATWFAVGISERGPTVPTPVRSMSDVARLFGARVTYGVLYDALDGFFGERGGLAYISRVVGPAATVATHTFNDISAAPSVRVDAANPGDWGARLTVEIAAGTAAETFQIIVFLDGAEVDSSGDLADVTAAVGWGANSDWVRVTALGVNDPAVVAATALTGGTDDRASITDAHWQAALDRFTRDLGPGQVSMPGRYSTVAHGALNAHGQANNRWPLRDEDPNGSRSAIVTSSLAVRALGTDLARRGQTFDRWGVVTDTTGTTRLIPYSAIHAGMVARSDDRHVFRLIDGQGFELSDFRNDLAGMLERKWLDREIYGLTAADASAVDVDPPVNTLDTIAQRKLRANIAFKPSRGARTVEIEIGNTPLTEAL
jgi:hypothetical protein